VRVKVACRPGHRGEPTPARLTLGAREVELVELLDAWLAADHSYFKLRGADGALYILRHDRSADDWTLTLFDVQQPRP
jgi:hypothetical protein